MRDCGQRGPCVESLLSAVSPQAYLHAPHPCSGKEEPQARLRQVCVLERFTFIEYFLCTGHGAKDVKALTHFSLSITSELL